MRSISPRCRVTAPRVSRRRARWAAPARACPRGRWPSDRGVVWPLPFRSHPGLIDGADEDCRRRCGSHPTSGGRYPVRRSEDVDAAAAGGSTPARCPPVRDPPVFGPAAGHDAAAGRDPAAVHDPICRAVRTARVVRSALRDPAGRGARGVGRGRDRRPCGDPHPAVGGDDGAVDRPAVPRRGVGDRIARAAAGSARPDVRGHRGAGVHHRVETPRAGQSFASRSTPAAAQRRCYS